MPWAAKKARARSTKPVTVRGLFVVVQLDVGQPRVVVDDRVRVVVADAGAGGHPVPIALRAITGRAMARTAKARVGADVHVQQIARPRPLIAVRCAPVRSRAAREPVAAQHLPDRLMRLPGGAGDQARPPTGGLADRADPRRKLIGDPPGLAMRAARAILKPRPARARLRRRGLPPAMRRGHRNRTLGGRGPQRASPLNQTNTEPASRPVRASR